MQTNRGALHPPASPPAPHGGGDCAKLSTPLMMTCARNNRNPTTGAAAHPLPAGTGSPQIAPKAVAAAGAGGGGAVSTSATGAAAAAVVAAAAAAAAAGGRAAYPGGAEHMSAEPNHDRKGAGGGPAYARYPPLSVPLSRVSSHEDPRNPRPAAPARGPGPPDGHDDPRGAHPRAAAAWERGPPPQNQRVAERSPPQAEFAEDYPPPPPPPPQQLQQQQLQRQQSWPAGRPRGENGASAAAAPPPPPPRYVDEGEPDPYGPGLRQRQPPPQQLHQQHQQQQQRQWYRRESHDEGEDPAWEQPGRDHYPPPRRAAVAAVAGRPEHPSEYLQYGPSSRWHDEVDPHAGGPRAGYVVDGAGGQRRLPSRASPRGGPPRGYADMPPHELRGEGSYDDGDLDEDVPGGKRRRPLAPPLARSTSRGGGAPAGGRGAWEEDAGYALPPAPSIRGEDFEKEVVKAAALLVAEREMRAREAARKEEKRGWPEEADPSRRYDDRKVVPRAHGAPAVHGAPAHGAAVQGGAHMRGSAEGHRRGSVEGRRRPPSSEGVERRGQRNTDSRDRVERDSRSGGRGRGGSGGSGGRGSSGRGGSGGAADRGSWKDGAAEDAWSGSKRPRGDGSPAGRGGGGRGEDRKISKGRGEGKGEGRRTSDEKRAADEPKAKPTRRAESRERHLAEGRDRHRDDSKGKYRDETRAKPDGRPPAGSGDKDKERHPPSLRVSQPGTEWERNGKRSDFQAEDGRRPWQSGDGGGGFGGDSSSRGDTGYFVHVGGISFSTTFTTLAKRFAAFGDVNGFKVIFNNVTCRSADISAAAGDGADRSKRHDRRHEGKGGAKEEASKAAVVTASTGFAFISFEDERSMDKAIAGMNDQTLDGHVLKVSRGRMPGKFSVQHYRPYPELASPSNFSGSRGPANKWSAPKGRSEYEPYQPYQKQHHQPNLNHYRPPERGDRRPAPVSPAASAAAASIVAAAATSSSSALASSRRGGGGGAAATAAAAADKAKESDRPDDAPNGKRARHSGPRERKLGDGPGAADQRDGGSGIGGRTIKTEKDSGGGGGGDGGDSRESGKGSAKVKKEIQETVRSPATSARSTRTEKRPTIRMTSGLTRPNS